MMRLDPVLEGFLAYLRVVGRKVPRTIVALKQASEAFGQSHPGRWWILMGIGLVGTGFATGAEMMANGACASSPDSPFGVAAP